MRQLLEAMNAPAIFGELYTTQARARPSPCVALGPGGWLTLRGPALTARLRTPTTKKEGLGARPPLKMCKLPWGLEGVGMSFQGAFAASLFGIFGCTSLAYANSCSNVNVHGSFDQSGLRESEYGIYAAGTFRIAGEDDEGKQPMFNLASIDCENQRDDTGRVVSLECKVATAVVWAQSGQPDTAKPNCSLDLNFSTFPMKELEKGVLTGVETSAGCYNRMLTIDRNTKRVYLSFTRTQYADNYDKTLPGTCGRDGAVPRTQVLMNCTAYAGLRKQGGAPPRYCDFSGVGDK
jgi:hypothetical protein